MFIICKTMCSIFLSLRAKIATSFEVTTFWSCFLFHNAGENFKTIFWKSVILIQDQHLFPSNANPYLLIRSSEIPLFLSSSLYLRSLIWSNADLAVSSRLFSFLTFRFCSRSAFSRIKITERLQCDTIHILIHRIHISHKHGFYKIIIIRLHNCKPVFRSDCLHLYSPRTFYKSVCPDNSVSTTDYKCPGVFRK